MLKQVTFADTQINAKGLVVISQSQKDALLAYGIPDTAPINGPNEGPPQYIIPASDYVDVIAYSHSTTDSHPGADSLPDADSHPSADLLPGADSHPSANLHHSASYLADSIPIDPTLLTVTESQSRTPHQRK